MSKTIVLDPGHGGIDPGAVNGSRREADDNLRLALAVRDKLTGQGHTVALTHAGLTGKQKLELNDRRLVAINAGADLFVSLHRNSAQKRDASGNPMFSGGLPVLDPAPKGIEIWIRNTAHTQAASEVLEQLCKVKHQANRGVKIGAYAVLYNMSMPAMLLELGFISNAEDNRLFDAHLDDNATAIARGILAALGEGWKESGQAEKPPLYRVQVGAFGVKEGAEGFLATVRGMGLDAFLVAPDTAKEDN